MTDIRRTGPALRRRTLVLDDDPWRDVPSAVVKALGLCVADEYDRVELAAQVDEAERPLARERALRLLTARERSRAGLIARLIDDGYAADVAHSTVTDLVRVGLVDDQRFAFAYARTMAHARGMGRSGMERELRAAGVDDDLVTAALDECLGAGVEEASAHRLAANAASRPNASVDKITARLVRKGYRLPLALAAAKQAIREAGSAEADAASHEDPFCD
jgi:regulatory protein